MRLKHLSFTVILSFLFTCHLFAQGQLKGFVYDSLSNEALIGANVVILGTSLGSATDIEGAYKILNAPEGKVRVRVSYIGYQSRNYIVTIEKDRPTQKNFYIAPIILEGAEIIVTGQALGQASAINQQINSNTIINVLSEERIQELPDANAAEAIGRLPGVSLQRSGGEANKIVLRGMSDKYSTVTIDGIRLAPTDQDSRGIDLSTISQGSLAGIELYKALTPDKDADAIAGSVNLVTRKAPSKRMLRVDTKGAYSDLKDTYKQYDFALRYGERFFDDIFGIQATGNLEQKDRSNERVDPGYDLNKDGNRTAFEITNLGLNHTRETRARKGFSLLLDVNTPDDGSIRVNNTYNSTERKYVLFTRNYPVTNTDLLYTARDREMKINTFNSSIRGENNFFDLAFHWGLSFAQSLGENPYDCELRFKEESGMKAPTLEILRGPIEGLVTLANNNFDLAYLNQSFFRDEKNIDKEKTAFLDVSGKYFFGDLITGDLKFGGKYRHKDRIKNRHELICQNYVSGGITNFFDTSSTYSLPNGQRVFVIPAFSGSQFYKLTMGGNAITARNFFGYTPEGRDLFGKYNLYPILNPDALRTWYDLTRNDSYTRPLRSMYSQNNEADLDYYEIVERVSSGYLMNTLNYSDWVTWIVGIRAESESNDYTSRYSPGVLTGFPTPSGTFYDTTASHTETVWLPNTQVLLRPTDFMNVRLAAYRALARPDFNWRLNKFLAEEGNSTLNTNNGVTVGNTNLVAAKAWNYEINTSFFGAEIGYISFSAYLKNIQDMFHYISGFNAVGNTLLDSLGSQWKVPAKWGTATVYQLFMPYNSRQDTRVWGFEIEHQTNFRWLPGYLQHLVLNYNFSWARTESHVPYSKTDTSYIVIGGIKFPKYSFSIRERKDKLEGQPEFFGNAALGYDIAGFSARISVFYQSEYPISFSIDSKNDNIQGEFIRWDLAFKYEYSEYLSIFLNFNNINNAEETTWTLNRVKGWKIMQSAERYGMTADLGFRYTL